MRKSCYRIYYILFPTNNIFPSYNLTRADDEGIFEDDDTIEGESAFLAAATAAEIVQKKKGGEKTTATSTTTSTSSTGRLRKREELGNWADLFFVLDVMSGSIDVCEILVFISKTDPLVRQLEEKRVDSGETSNIRTPQRWRSSSSGKSFLDSYDHKLTILFTDVGSLEQLLGIVALHLALAGSTTNMYC